MAKSPKYDDEDEYDLKADSSDDDGSWNSKPPTKKSPPQHATVNTSSRKAKVRLNAADDDLDFGDDDDDADNAELFARFTAPVSISSKSDKSVNLNSTVSTSAGASAPNRDGKPANNGKMFTSSSGKGSAGIRGIQELLREPNAYGSKNNNSSTTTSSTTSGNTNSNLLSGIKPGQAIRVKAPGKRRNYHSTSDQY